VEAVCCRKFDVEGFSVRHFSILFGFVAAAAEVGVEALEEGQEEADEAAFGHGRGPFKRVWDPGRFEGLGPVR